jgi:hypothetical protein
MQGKKKSDTDQQYSQLDLWGNKNAFHWKEFKAAREYVRSFKLKDYAGWEELVNKRKLHGTNIPSNPDEVYKNHGWKDWEDWLGTEEPRTNDKKPPSSLFDSTPGDDLWSAADNSKWMNFFEARKKVWDYGFKYREEWELHISGKFPGREPLPDKIPGNPDQVYKYVGWKNWKDWLIHPDQQKEYTEFHKARDFVRSCRIPGKDAWHDFLKENKKLTADYQMVLPERPHLEYSDFGWIGWEDWLGSEIQFRDFISTRKFIHTLKLKNQQEWISFCRGQLLNKPPKTDNIYSYPEIAYHDNGWKGWDDWLGSLRKDEAHTKSSELHDITIECRCKGKIEHCPICDGKGYYNRKI